APQEGDRVVDAILFDPMRAELLRQPGVELEQRLVRNRAAQSCIDTRIDALRIDQTLEEPDRGAIRKALQLGDAERRLRRQLGQDLRMRQPSRPVERAEGTR